MSVTRRRTAASLVVAASTLGLVAAALPATIAPASQEVPAPRVQAAAARTIFFGADQWEATKDLGSLYRVAKTIRAEKAWKKKDSRGVKVTGEGVGVALIDTGVAPVRGLDGPGKITNGPDLSFEGQDEDLRYLDSYGHGTHMAGIIAARDPDVEHGHEDDSKHLVGVAPDAHIVNVKVAGSDGAADVSQLIAAIDWVVQHRADPGMNVRVLSLSFGLPSSQGPDVDPLAYAVENAWRHGIVVVAAAGNDGAAGTTLDEPAADPYVVAVGASDNDGTDKRDDDSVSSFSSVGNPDRRPDVVAPGRSVVGLRVQGSAVDLANPEGRVTSEKAEQAEELARYMRGSGTSQSTAVVAGAAALLVQQRPTLTPDQVKALLVRGAEPLKTRPSPSMGAGQLDLEESLKLDTPEDAAQTWPAARGTGSLDSARGGVRVADPENGEELTGEQDIFGQPWDAAAWVAATTQGQSWQGGTWNGSDWTGDAWTRMGWAGRAWHGSSWTGRAWHGRAWHENTWTGRAWHGEGWSGRAWHGRAWHENAWS